MIDLNQFSFPSRFLRLSDLGLRLLVLETLFYKSSTIECQSLKNVVKNYMVFGDWLMYEIIINKFSTNQIVQ